MNKKLRIVIPVVAGVLAISAGIGVAAAKTSGQNAVYQPFGHYQIISASADTDNTTGPWHCGFGGMMGYGAGSQVTPPVATLLGTTVADLEIQLNSGKTLADIAGDKGISREQLIQTIIAPYSDHLDIMVKYGYLTREQANNLLQQARERAQATITSTFQGDDDYGWGHMGGMMNGWGYAQQQPRTNGAPRSGSGGMMNNWGYAQPQPNTNPAPGSGFGGMMGGFGGRW